MLDITDDIDVGARGNGDAARAQQGQQEESHRSPNARLLLPLQHRRRLPAGAAW
jgi:hypothetical protein